MDSVKRFFANVIKPYFTGGRKRSATEFDPELTDDEENIETGLPRRSKRMKPSCSPCASTDDDVILASPTVHYVHQRLLAHDNNVTPSASLETSKEQNDSVYNRTFASPKAIIKMPSRPIFKRPSLIQPMKQPRRGFLEKFRNTEFNMNCFKAYTRADTIRLKEKQDYKNMIAELSNRGSVTITHSFRAVASGSMVLEKVSTPKKSSYLNQLPDAYGGSGSSRSGEKKGEILLIDISSEDLDASVSSNVVALPSALATSTPCAPLTSTPCPAIEWRPSKISTPKPSISTILTPFGSEDSIQHVRPQSQSSLKLDELGLRIKSILDRTLGSSDHPITIDDDEDKRVSKQEDDDEPVILSSSILKSHSINSLELSLQESPYASKEWLESRIRESAIASREREDLIEQEVKTLDILRKESTIDRDISERIRRNLTLNGIIELEPEEKEEEFPEITAEMQLIIDEARAPGMNLQHVIVRTQNNVAITKSDIKSLAPLQWLNDNVIDAYIDLIVRRSKVKTDWPLVYAFTTFFYPKLCNEGYSNTLKRWTRKVDIFSYDLLIFPIHLGIHWCLAAADKRSKTIKYYDSLGGKNHQCCRVLLDYMRKEHEERKKASFNASEWSLEVVEGIPHQQNGSDCGMFSCKFAEYLSRDAELTFKQEDMNYFRERMIYEIISQNILHP